MKKKTVLILSGGLDSVICAYTLMKEKKEIYCLTFDYGQKARKEIVYARKIASLINAADHKILKINLGSLLSSSLFGKTTGKRLKKGPMTYVPARNMIFLAIAAGYAETLGAYEIVIGTDQVYGGSYAECRLNFMMAMENAINLGCNIYNDSSKKLEIYLPLVFKRKEENIIEGQKIGVPYEKTWSCYNNGKYHCGRCINCKTRIKGFKLAHIIDPTKYLLKRKKLIKQI